MKTLLKIIAVLAIIIVALLTTLPFIYKSEIINLTKKELNKNINAKVDFSTIDFTLLTSFPNFNLNINNLIVSGKNKFESDTIAIIEDIDISIDMMSVFNAENYKVKRIVLHNPSINIKVLENGAPNYNIFPENEPAKEKAVSQAKTTNTFNLDISKFKIINGQLCYSDISTKTIIRLSGINHSLSGNMNSDKVTLKTYTKIANTHLEYDNINYISDIAIAYKANIDADFKNEIYTLGNNELIANDLKLQFSGSISTIEEQLNLLLTFASNNNEFNNILSLIPSIYTNDFQSINTSGIFSVEGMIKGTYTTDKLPSFAINIKVDDGMLKYPDLPQSISEIFVEANISNKGGNIDNTILNIQKLKMNLGKNPISTKFKISTPISDPNINAEISGTFNLSDIKNYYPINEKLSGTIITDISLNGQLSSLEKEHYDEFTAMGSMIMKDIIVNTDIFISPINITHAQLNFAPQYIDLVDINIDIKDNDFRANGKINNYLGYYLKDKMLAGELSTTSKYMNIDELLAVEKPKTTADTNTHQTSNAATSTDAKTINIPDNINFTLSSKFDNLIYDNLDLKNVVGDIRIENSELIIDNMQMDAAGGNIALTGVYSTATNEQPHIKMAINITKVKLNEALENFALLRNYIPLAESTTGTFSTNFNINTELYNTMIPNYSTMNGKGNIKANKIGIKNAETVNKFAEALSIKDGKELHINDINLNFNLINGSLNVEPTKFKIAGMDAGLNGSTSLDKSINYNVNVDIPRSKFGKSANNLVDGLISQLNSYGTNFSVGDIIPLYFTIGGTIENPNLSYKPGVPTNVKSGTNQVNNQKNNLATSTKLSAQDIIEDGNIRAKKVLVEAQKSANKLKTDAAINVANLNKEANKQASKLIEEGKKNGILGESASQEAVNQLKKELKLNTDKILDAADKQGVEIMDKARKRSESIKKEAQEKAEKIRKR